MTDWQTIVHEHRGLVWRVVYRLLENTADAEDCFQDTFVSALQVSKRQRVRNWRALLAKIATNRALDRLRQRIRLRGRFETPAECLDCPAPEPGPNQGVENSELAVHLREALAQLPADQAEVFCLRHVEQMSYRDIAKTMAIKSNAVGVLLHRARARLRDLLSPVLAEGE